MRASDPPKLRSAVSPDARLTEPFAVAPMPSICPEASTLGSPPSARRKAANLSDDEPALRVRITESKGFTPPPWRRPVRRYTRGVPPQVFVQLPPSGGDEPGAIVIASARQPDRRFVPKRQSR